MKKPAGAGRKKSEEMTPEQVEAIVQQNLHLKMILHATRQAIKRECYELKVFGTPSERRMELIVKRLERLAEERE